MLVGKHMQWCKQGHQLKVRMGDEVLDFEEKKSNSLKK